jgi:hypothetical protein
MMRSRTPIRKGDSNVTVGEGPVGVPLPIGGTSAILTGASDDRTVPSLFSEAEGGGKEEVTRVTARSRLSIVAVGKGS